MKKLFALLLALSLVLALAACGGDKPSGDRVSIPPPAGTQSENPGGQENPPDSTPDTSTPDADDTVTLVKEDAFNFVAGLDYVEEMTLAFDGNKIVKCSIKETYADEESAKAGEAANKDNDQYVNVTRDGDTVSYDYSDEWCKDSFEFFKGKDMTISHFGEKGYTQK